MQSVVGGTIVEVEIRLQRLIAATSFDSSSFAASCFGVASSAVAWWAGLASTGASKAERASLVELLVVAMMAVVVAMMAEGFSVSSNNAFLFWRGCC